MQRITLSFLLIAVAVAQAAAASTYSATANIFSAAVAASSVALVSAKNSNEVKTGICTGGTTYCGWFSSSDCPYPYCDTNPFLMIIPIHVKEVSVMTTSREMLLVRT